MNYLLDKKIKRNKFLKYFVFFIFLFLILYFNAGFFAGLSSFSHTIFKPFLSLSNGFNEGVFHLSSYFSSKNSLMIENEGLKQKILEQDIKMLDYDALTKENEKLKEILGRSPENKNFILVSILSKPNKSIYDTLIIDSGSSYGVSEGDRVFALGNIPVGYVEEVFESSAKVVLYSNPGVRTEVSVPGSDTFLELVGRGGGNFEMILPREFDLPEGTTVMSLGNKSYVIAKVETIISDPRDSFKKALLVSPVNIQSTKFLEIEK